MDSCNHDGFLDSRWVPGFTMGFWTIRHAREGGILRGSNEAPSFGWQEDGILRGTNEAPRFGKAPKGNPKENKAKGILRGTNDH